MERLLADLGVTTAQFAVLTMLDAYPHASGADVARLALLTPQTVHGITGNLRRAGLVEATPSMNHRRIQTLALTTAGQELLATCKARVAVLEQDLAVGLTDGEKGVIRKWLVRLALPGGAE
ncbi:MAG: MarR family winged helix-turn-helix transcriptional regulator [Janthinobacterium lividum]